MMTSPIVMSISRTKDCALEMLFFTNTNLSFLEKWLMADSRYEAEYAQADDLSYYTEKKLSKTTVSK